jgi:CheY-like chemotaxis protein
MLKTAGFSVASAKDGVDALKRLRAGSYDLMLLDVWMPKMNGLDVLAALPKEGARPRVVVMTSDDTPETLLRAVREQAWRYVAKPVEPQALVELLREVLAQTTVAPRLKWCQARPDWVELLVPCERAVVDRIESFMTHLEGDLAVDVRESIGYAFRELLMNAIEWAEGSTLPAPCAGRFPQGTTDVALSHRRSWSRLQRGGAVARRHRPARRRSDGARDRARGKGAATRWIRDSDRACESRRAAVQRKAQRGRVREVSGLTRYSPYPQFPETSAFWSGLACASGWRAARAT